MLLNGGVGWLPMAELVAIATIIAARRGTEMFRRTADSGRVDRVTLGWRRWEKEEEEEVEEEAIATTNPPPVFMTRHLIKSN